MTQQNMISRSAIPNPKMAFEIRAICVLILLINVIEASHPVVTVEQGTIVGKQLEFSVGESTHTVDAYRGIPYAEAPIGELRFKPPVPKEWQGNLNAQELGKACPQIEMFFMNLNFTESGMDEDCLVLNVFVPQPTVGINLMLFPGRSGWVVFGGVYVEGVWR